MSKSVSTTLEQDDYDALKALAKEQDRNISGQMRHMLKRALKQPDWTTLSAFPVEDDGNELRSDGTTK